MTKREKIGAGLVAFPFILLTVTIIGYVIMGFFIKRAIETGAVLPHASVLGQIVSIVLGFSGLAALFGFFIAIPIGVYLAAIPARKK